MAETWPEWEAVLGSVSGCLLAVVDKLMMEQYDHDLIDTHKVSPTYHATARSMPVCSLNIQTVGASLKFSHVCSVALAEFGVPSKRQMMAKPEVRARASSCIYDM